MYPLNVQTTIFICTISKQEDTRLQGNLTISKHIAQLDKMFTNKLLCLQTSHGKKSYTALNQNVYLIFRLGGPGVNELGMMLHHLSDQT